ncbi:AsmA family protein [Amphritea sp. HPY]|uniref:AsmA family protein n=1 Tax=Amphritea sp. HPY TaxID=3421652 RepID=UPI003D7D6F30
MKGLLKIVGGLVALLVIVVVAGGVLLGMFFDPNEYKPEIKKLALEQGGVELNIDGDLGWSVFPWLGIEINQISVNYPGQPQLAELNQAQVSVEIPALLSGNVKMSSIVLDGLTLNLVKTKDGKTNWAISGAGQQVPGDTAEAEATTPDAAEAAGGAALALDIESIAITNGNISYDDQMTASKVLLNNFSMTSGKVVTDAFFPAELSFQAEQFQAGEKQLTVDAGVQAEFFLDLAEQKYDIKGLKSTLGLSGAPFNGKSLSVNLAADIASNLGDESTRIDNLKLTAANLNATGNVAIQGFAKPTITGQLEVDSFSLQELLAALGQPTIETTDPAVLKAISFSSELGGPANTLGLNKLKLKLDDTNFNGSFAFNLANGAIALNLQGDEINADRYLPPAKEAKQAAGSESAAKASGERYSKEPVIPRDTIKGLNLDVKLGLDKLLMSGLTLTKLQLQTDAHGGLVNVSKINADMYGGTLRNSAVIDVRKSLTRLSSKKNVKGIQIGDLLMDMAEVDRITGTFSSQSSMTARGESVHAIVNSLNGTASVSMPKGEIRGIDIAQSICQGFNNVASLGINAEQVDGSTPFANLGGNFKVTNGVVSNNDLKAALDAMVVKGRGKVNLPKANLDYRLGLTIEEDLFKQTCSVNNSLQGVEWPMDCKGSFDDDPAKLCRPDASVLEDIIKQKAKKKLESKLMEKLGGGSSDGEGDSKVEGAKKLLRGLFGE